MIEFIRKIRNAWYLSGVERHMLNFLPLHGRGEREIVFNIVMLHSDEILHCRDNGVSARRVACSLAEEIWLKIAARAHAQAEIRV